MTSAVGATYIGAQKSSYNLPRDYSKNISPIFKYSQSNCPTIESQKAEKPALAMPSDCGRSLTGGKITEKVYESGNTNGNINGENGHGKISTQVSEVTVGIKSKAIEKPIST